MVCFEMQVMNYHKNNSMLVSVDLILKAIPSELDSIRGIYL